MSVESSIGDHHRQKNPSLSKGIAFLVLLVLVVAGLLFAASLLRSEEGPRVAAAAPMPLTVSVIEAEMNAEFELEETYSGLAEARRTSQLGFSSGGRIAAINVDIGDRVKARQTLATLDTRALRAQLASAEASVDEARASHALGLSTVERQITLKARGHVSQQSVDEAQAQADTALARVEATKAQADILRVQIDLARISSPFEGTITRRFADEGAIAGAGVPILEIVEAGHLEARIGVPPAGAVRLEPGEVYALRADTGSVDAELSRITGVIDPAQRTVTAVFEIADPGQLPVGSVVRLSMSRSIDEPGFWVPVKALSAGSRGLWSVYVAEPEGDGFRVAVRPVEIVHTDGDQSFARGPVRAGERIIVDGLQRLVPGMLVEPRNAITASTVNDG